MVRAGQFAAALLDFAQHPADHRTQGFLDDGIIGDQAVGPCRRSCPLVASHVARVKRFKCAFTLSIGAIPCAVVLRRSSAARMRTGRIERNTAETKILVEVDLDGSGSYDVAHPASVSLTIWSNNSPSIR